MTTIEIYNIIRNEYLPRHSIFDKDADKVAKIKRGVARLSPSDQAIFIHYCEDRSLQRLANRFKVSKAFMHKTIQRIRREILK